MRLSYCPSAIVFLLTAALVLPLSMNATSSVRADSPDGQSSYVGQFSDDRVTLKLDVGSAGGLAGVFIVGGKEYPAQATVRNGALNGSFVVDDDRFTFTATLSKGGLTLESGGKTHTLTRPAGPTAPASSIAPAAHAGPTNAFAGDDKAGGFTVLGQNAAGQTLYLNLPNAKTLEDALIQTADALGQVLDAKPELSNAFADAKAKVHGGVTLTGKRKGQDVRGVIFCGVGPSGGSANVVIAAANASPADVAALRGFLPAPLHLQKHNFPDNSGSIDLPEGWTTVDQTATYGIGVRGPEGQSVSWHVTTVFNEPECNLVKHGRELHALQVRNYQTAMNNYRQLQIMRQRTPNLPPPRPPLPPPDLDPDPNVQYPLMNFCAYCDGADEVLKNWYPIREQKQRRAGKDYTTLDKVMASFPADPNPYIAGSKSGVAYVALTDHLGDAVTHARAVTRITTSPLLEGQSWQISVDNLRAPDDTFDQDLPVMSAIINSIDLNMEVVNSRLTTDGAQQRKIFADRFAVMTQNNRDFQDAQAQRFADHEQQIAAQEKARHDSASDFIEYIGGVRQVYDTKTGRTMDVDLFHSDAIVDGLNASVNDPHQFVQIPLRYRR